MTVPLKTAENNSKTEIIGRKGCGKNLKTISNHNKISGTNIFLEMAHTATANIRENKESNGSEREESATPRNQRHLKEEDLLIVLRRSILVTER